MPLMDSLYRTALRVLRNEKAAEDLVQDTMLKAFRNYEQFKTGTNFKAWIFTILMNAFRNQYRKAQLEPKTIDVETVSMFYAAHGDDMFTAVDSGDADLGAMMSDEVKRELDNLPPEFREVVLLALVEGFSYQEISSVLGIPMGTVMSRLFRGRQLLKQRLTDYAKSMGYLKRA